ncbi:MAG TPA: arginine--tRNA ligase [Acidimicrobiales bacterium]|nr:arginine--tRNA ligase [Acidimicrobiales bacterium]
MIRDSLTAALRSALTAAGIDAPAEIHLERPARREHGDWSSNVALATAKAHGRVPRELAADLVAHLEQAPPAHVERVEIAGPGFVNFHLRETWLHDVLVDVVEAGEDGFARLDLGGGRTVNVEFVSANPTGPLHAGGGRWAAYGDALCRILERTGHRVHREYYLNDRGVQMQLFGASLVARKAGTELPEDGYAGEYIAEWAAEMPDDADPVEWGYERVKRDLRESLAAIGVEFDTWFSERSLVESGAIDATLAELRERGVAYDQDGAVWLRTTDFGDDKDRVLVKSDGEPTYLLPDIAYHRDKFARGHELLIDIWGSDHHGYVARLKAGVQALGHDPEDLEIILGQLVVLVRGGEEVRLSKRAGTMVLLDDLVEAVGADVARLTFLLQSLDTRQTIDLDLITAQSNENPVFYVQYANARIHSIGRKAAEAGVVRGPLAEADLSLLVHERELDVLRKLSELPEVLELACVDRAPHKITTWVRELADRFHGFYHDCYVIGDVPPELTQARLWLVEAARIGLSIGLDLLGVSAPESM